MPSSVSPSTGEAAATPQTGQNAASGGIGLSQEEQGRSRMALRHLLLRVGMALVGRLLQPEVGQGVRFFRAFALEVRHPEPVLGVLVALLGRAAEPAHRLGLVLVHPLPPGVHVADLGLSTHVALLGDMYADRKSTRLNSSHGYIS